MFTIVQSIEPFTVLLALVPLIGYLAVFSVIRLSGRVLVTTSVRDIGALAIAISGMMAVGPAELFFPATAAIVFGPMVWLALAALYGLTVALIALTTTPKLVVYGRTPEEVFPALMRASSKIDPQANGDVKELQVHLPNVGIRLRVDGQRGVDHARVLTFEPMPSLKFLNTLLANLRAEVRQSPTPATRRGLGMLVATLLLSMILVWQSFENPALVVEGFRDWLWR